MYQPPLHPSCRALCGLLLALLLWTGLAPISLHAEEPGQETPRPAQNADQFDNLPPLPFLRPTLAVSDAQLRQWAEATGQPVEAVRAINALPPVRGRIDAPWHNKLERSL